MPNWLERLKGESQASLLALLRRSHQTITGLAERLRLSDNAVRTHVAVLEREGLVEPVGTQRDTGGKPARLYALTVEGEELFPKAYAMVLGQLVEEIARQDGPGRAVELLRMIGKRVASGSEGSPDLATRVASAAVALRSLGGEVDVQRENGGWRLQGYGCPLSAVTASRPEVCGLAKALVEEITGEPVVECCERSPRPRCGFRIEETLS
jgi:predicted ArsR family transcriptional regulator